MRYTTFKEFLSESADSEMFAPELTSEQRDDLNYLFNDLEEDERDSLGSILYTYFFDDEDDDNEEDNDDFDDFDYNFGTEDLWSLVNAIGQDAYQAIEIILDGSWDTEDEDDVQELFDALDDLNLNENVSRRMKVSSMNRSRKYMKLTRAKLRAQKADRKRKSRQNRQKRKRYQRVNKRKIKAYQKSRRDAIKKGKHIVKKRR